MKALIIATLGFILAASPGLALAKAELKDKKAKVSYAIGLDLGKTMAQDKIELNIDAFCQGFKDGLAAKKPKMSAEEMEQVLSDFQQEMMERQEKAMAVAAKKNKKAGDKFREDYLKKTGVKELPSGLMYRSLKTGKGHSPKETDEVIVHYEGKLVDGTVFDSTYKQGEPIPFFLSDVIPGWQNAIKKMKVGDKWEVVIPPELAYGEAGDPPTIGPESTLIFTIELISAQEPQTQPEDDLEAEPDPNAPQGDEPPVADDEPEKGPVKEK